jgi:cell division transport system permease protein
MTKPRLALPSFVKGWWRSKKDRAAHPALVPVESIAGRALIIVIAIMTFLAALTAGAAQLVGAASSEWQSAVAREVTIQVRPVAGRAIDQEVTKAADIARATQGIAAVKIYSREESERLLEPWLGTGLNLDQLPVPRLIVLRLDEQKSPDFAALRKALADNVRGVTLDDHRLWIARLASMAQTLVILALGIVALVITATALAVAFATRGAMAGNRDIVEVLHFVGASDSFIADEFQNHFLRLGLKGGLAGGLAAMLFFIVAGSLASAWVATPGGDQIEALFGSFSLGSGGFIAMALIIVLVALVTSIGSRLTVMRTLRQLN